VEALRRTGVHLNLVSRYTAPWLKSSRSIRGRESFEGALLTFRVYIGEPAALHPKEKGAVSSAFPDGRDWD